MSDKTFGVKVSEDLYEKVKLMIENSGTSSKEWFEKAVSLSEVQNLKEGARDYQSDLGELEVHTARIYQLVANMVQRANYLKEDAVKNLTEKLESRDETISSLQIDLKQLKEAMTILSGEKTTSENEKEVLSKQVEELRITNENTQSLIQEYKDKIDTLSSLVNQYKGYAEENVQLKEQHKKEKEQMLTKFEQKEGDFKSSIEKLKTTLGGQKQTVDELKEKIKRMDEEYKKEKDELEVNHKNELTRINKEKQIEKESAILETKQDYQGRLDKAHEEYSKTITRLYEKLGLDNNED